MENIAIPKQQSAISHKRVFLSVIGIGFIASVLIAILTYGVEYLPILSSNPSAFVQTLINTIFVLLCGSILIIPAILLGIKMKWKSGIWVIVSELIWLIIFTGLIILFFPTQTTIIREPIQTYPVQPCIGCGEIHPDKPVIYLYPTSKENVSVQLNYGGSITSLYPKFADPINHIWNVTAYPDGHIINPVDGQDYNYLFWEGSDNQQYDLSTGFVVKGSDTAVFLQGQLAKMGLQPKEYNEFIVYWLPKLQNNPYNLIHFAGTDYTNFAKLDINPKPDSLLRVFMVYKPLNQAISIPSQSFSAFSRNGFTVVEWGGEEAK